LSQGGALSPKNLPLRDAERPPPPLFEQPAPPEPALARPLKLSVLESILDGLQFGVSVRDEKLELLYANRAWPGLRDEAAAAETDDGAPRQGFLREEMRLAHAVLSGGRALSEHVEIPGKGNALAHYKLVSWPLAGARRHPVVVSVSVDVSDVVCSGELREELFQMLVHDVHNHAVAVLRNLELLLAGTAGPLNLPQAEVVRATQECGNVLAGMTSDIQDVTLFEAGQIRLRRTEFCLAETVEISARHCQGLGLDRRVRLETLPRTSAALVNGDRRRIERVIINLLMNAVQFSPAGSRVRVDCRPGEGPGWTVEVEDEGPGIQREYHEAVFRKYFRIPQPGETLHAGLGLGLYFCRQTVQAHGGRIWIESPAAPLARGTRVLFSLPHAQEERS
jgi:NtrC-family two-component system sensor histidine kinase KinB